MWVGRGPERGRRAGERDDGAEPGPRPGAPEGTPGASTTVDAEPATPSADRTLVAPRGAPPDDDAPPTPQAPPAGDDAPAAGPVRALVDALRRRTRPSWQDRRGGRRHPRPKWPRRVALALVVLIVLPPTAAGAALRVSYAGETAAGTTTRGRDAIWLGHAWVDGRKNAADLRRLGARLHGTGIRDLYVHAGPLEDDGTLPPAAYPGAHRFVEAVHRTLPGVRVQAWLGDVLATEGPDGMRLERADTRDAVVRSTRQILDVGFDGVHFDLEPLHSGDGHYLALLDRLRRLTHARGAVLSVAAHQIDPLPALHAVAGALTGHPKWWSQEFFGQVARRVDQIAVMSYDTGMPLESLYGGYVAQQTTLALEVTPPTTDLLMGLPFYRENTIGHHAWAETVAAAVRGTRLGLGRTDRDRARFGVALYVDFAASDEDWRAYRTGWLP